MNASSGRDILPVGLATAEHRVTRGMPVRRYEVGDVAAANVRDRECCGTAA